MKIQWVAIALILTPLHFALAQTPENPIDYTKRPKLILRSQGGRDGGGGDTCKLDFFNIAKKIDEDIIQHRIEVPPEVTKEAFEDKINTANVQSIEYDLLLDEGEGTKYQDLLPHYKEQWVEINRFRWDAIESVSKKYQKVLHAFLVLMNINDAGNRISNLYLSDKEAGELESSAHSKIVAKPGSELDRYDHEVAAMTGASLKDLTAFVSRWYRLDAIELKSKTDKDLARDYLAFLAKNLRDLLPLADNPRFKQHDIIAPHEAIQIEEAQSRVHHSGVAYKIVIDGTQSGYQLDKPQGHREHKTNFVQICTLTLGKVDQIDVLTLRNWLSSFINCTGDEFSPETYVNSAKGTPPAPKRAPDGFHYVKIDHYETAEVVEIKNCDNKICYGVVLNHMIGYDEQEQEFQGDVLIMGASESGAHSMIKLIGIGSLRDKPDQVTEVALSPVKMLPKPTPLSTYSGDEKDANHPVYIGGVIANYKTEVAVQGGVLSRESSFTLGVEQ